MNNSLLIKNGTIATLGSENKIIENGAIAIKEGMIEKFGKYTDVVKNESDFDKVIDANGKLIMPGFINQHMHFYSTFARGMMPKQPPAINFVEILEKLWWPLDKGLNEKDLYYSAIIPLINGIRSGTTTVFDHHESQGFQMGSLDVIEKALAETGVRGNICLGLSDRYGKGKEGIDENVRFIKKLQDKNYNNNLITAMFGLHAAFTVEEDSLIKSAEEAKKLGVGFHIHVAEDLADQVISKYKYNKSVIKRLHDAGCLNSKTMAIHCIFMSDEEIEILKNTETSVVHIPQSNMNNGVGVADVLKIMENRILCGIGTDGMSPGVQSDVKTANILHKINKRDPRIFFCESCQLVLSNNSLISNKILPKKIGVIEEGFCADIILLNYNTPTPLRADNFFGHFLFGICDTAVDTTIVNGKILMENGEIKCVDEKAIFKASCKQAEDFWKNRF